MSEVVRVSDLAVRDSSLARHRAEASKELEAMEEKELELKRRGEALVRDQISGLGRELAMAITDFDAFKKVTLEGLKKMQATINEQAVELEAEKESRKQLERSFEDRVKSLNDELEQEKKDRAAGDERVLKDTRKEIQPLKEGIDAKTREIANLDREVQRLMGMINNFPSQLEKISESLRREIADRKAAEEPIMDAIRRLRDQLMKEIKELSEGHGAAVKTLRDHFDKEKSDRDIMHEETRNMINEINRDFGPHVKQIPLLTGKFKDLHDTLHPKLKDHKDELDRHRDLTTDVHKKHDQLLTDLLKKIDAESAARNNMMDELEQMNTGFRTKMRSLMNEESEKQKKEIEGVRITIKDVETRAKKTDEQVVGMMDQVATNKKNCETCIETTNIFKMDIERMLRKVDEVTQKVADLKVALNQGLSDRKDEIDSLSILLDQHISTLESLFHDLGERLLNGGVQRRFTAWISSKTVTTVTVAE